MSSSQNFIGDDHEELDSWKLKRKGLLKTCVSQVDKLKRKGGKMENLLNMWSNENKVWKEKTVIFNLSINCFISWENNLIYMIHMTTAPKKNPTKH